MKVIVTGATGFIGRPLTRELLAAGHEVVVWTRSPENAASALPARCQIAAWSPFNLPVETLIGADAVIHLAGEHVAAKRWTRARKRALESSRIDTSAAIVDAIASLPERSRPKCLLSASAIGYYGDRGDKLLDETSDPGAGFLPDLCVGWERSARSAAELGVRSAVLRIGIVLDSGGGMLENVLPLFRAGLGGRIGSGDQWMSWIHLDDVVRLFLHALENDDVQGPINAVAPNPVRNSDFTATLAACVGRPALLPAPGFGLRVLFGQMASIMTASQRLRPTAGDESGFEFRYPALGEALAEICSHEEHELIFEQKVDLPIDRAFAFFADARNLEKITPPFLHFAITSLPDGGTREGSLIQYKLRLHGVPIRWRTRIDAWQPPHSFIDVQEKGPYALWHHRHELEEEEGSTIVRDRIRYRLPFGAIGELVAGSQVAKELATIFRYRRDQISQILSADIGAPNE